MAGEWERVVQATTQLKDRNVASSTAGPLPSAVRHCGFVGVLLVCSNTAGKMRTVKHLQDYPMSLQNISGCTVKVTKQPSDVSCNAA
jgi:hypothetical protein